MKKITIALLLLIAISAKAQQKVIPLYNGPAPGSEKWTWNQRENDSNMYHSNAVFNVSKPTITVYPPDPAVAATGTAVIVCPGGGFQSLSIMQEGYAVVKWLQGKGITAFLLRYRLKHTIGDDPYKQETSQRSAKSDEERITVAGMATADAQTALTYVRAHATEYNISPSQIGLIGFSAGGYLAVATATNYTTASRPDFSAAIYPGFSPDLLKNIPTDAPPMFIAAASDDTFGLETLSTMLYTAWVNSKHSAEIHIYNKGGHGFGMNIQNLPSDSWRDRYSDWLNSLGLLKPLSTEKTEAMKNAENWVNYQKWVEDRVHNDWPWIKKYEDDNAKLPAPAPGEKRVVFMGNSITENWANMDSSFFKNNGYIGRGIGGQTSSQMLVRFREDVIDLHPKAVVIEAGTNDIAQNTGFISLENIYGNIVSMCELARASGIKPIIGSILPAIDFQWHRGLEPAEKIVKVNEWLKAYAAKNHFVYIDYWSALVNDKKGFKPELTNDGLVHPNMAGYKIMEPLVKKGIDETLKGK